MNIFDTLLSEAQTIVARYEQKRAAMLPVLRLVQERMGHITTQAEEWVGQLLGVAPSHVHEVVTFYSLYHQQPVGQYHVQVCHNIACALRGASGCLASISERLGIQPGETTTDGRYTAFGRVTRGLDVVDRIEPGDRILRAYVKMLE